MAIRNDYSQNRKLYVGNGTEVSVSDGNAIITGSVGIGTTSPSYKLHVNGGDAQIANGATGTLYMNNSNNYLYGDVNGVGIVAAGNNFRVKTNNSERIRVIQNGNVGIGTTSPLSKLQVGLSTSNSGSTLAMFGAAESGILSALSLVNTLGNSAAGYGTALDFHVNSVYSPTGRIATIAESTGTPAALAFYTYNSGLNEKMRITSAGNVGIGTSTPDQKLEVYGNIRIPNAGKIVFGTPGSTPDDYLQLNDIVATGSLLKLVQDTNTRFVVQGVTGNVGIGTNNPAVRLDFGSATGKAFHLYTSGADYYGFNMLQYDSGPFSTNIFAGNGGDIKLRTASGTSTQSTRLTVKAGGNVGIGTTSPGYPLEISNNAITSLVYQRTGVSANKWGFHSDNDATYWQNVTSGSLLFTLQNGGNVGIGTTSPVETLGVPSGKGVMLGFKKFYSNTGIVPAGIGSSYALTVTLNQEHGTTLTSQHQYKFYLTTIGTGTYNSSVYIVYRNSADTAWDVHRVSSTGLTSNHPELTVSSTSALIYNDHPSAYGVSYRVETSYTGQAKTSPEIFGSDYMWTRDNTDLHYMSGNVGIGTTSPAQKFVVADSTNGDGIELVPGSTSVIQAFDRTASLYNNLNIDTLETRVRSIGATVFNNGSGFLESMRIASSGNVGIGTTSPGEKLEVNGNIRLGNSPSLLWGSNNLTLKTASSSTIGVFSLAPNSDGTVYAPRFQMLNASGVQGVLIRTDGSSYFNGGNVGIGTTSPGAKLDVNAAGTGIRQYGDANNILSTYAGSGYQVLEATNSGTTNAFGYNSGAFYVQTAATERMRIDVNGNVGIGTTSPGEKLDVNGNINIGSIGSGVRGIKRSNDGYNLHLAGGSSLTGGAYIEVNGGSRGGVGSSVNGEIKLVSGGSYQSSQGALVGDYYFNTQWNGGSATLMKIDSSSGNVGIGTTSPGAKLEVSNGSSGFTGSYNGRTAAVFEGSNSAGTTVSIMSPSTGYSGLFFGDENNEAEGQIQYNHSESAFKFLNGGGSERMRITSGGKVLVGATDNQTQSKLTSRQNGSSIEFGHLNQSGQYYGTLGAMSSSGSPFIAFSSDNSVANSFTTKGAKGFVISQDTGISGDLIFSSVPLVNTADQGLVERMRITSGGNVGIGTNSPDAKLDVDGTSLFRRDVTIYHKGNNSAPSYELRFKGTNSSGVDKVHASLETSPYSSNTNAGTLLFKTANASNQILDTRMIIDGVGNVGIGTTGPTAKLHVDGTAIFDTQTGAQPFYITRDGATNQALKIYVDDSTAVFESIQDETANGYGSFDFKLDAGVTEPYFDIDKNNTNLFRVNGNGNVGIGTTSPSEKLDVVGGSLNVSDTYGTVKIIGTGGLSRVFLGDTADEDVGYLEYNHISNYFKIGVNAAERMRITSTGNVGIGTTNPGSYKLKVAGVSDTQGLVVGYQDLLLYDNNTYSPEFKMTNNTHSLGIDYQNNETLRFITRSGVTTVPITFQMRAGTITATNFIFSSDERKKTKIADLSCDNIDVSWKSFEMKDNEGEYRTGVVAQELEQKHPEFVNTNDEGFKSVKYIDLLIAKIAELEARLEKLEK